MLSLIERGESSPDRGGAGEGGDRAGRRAREPVRRLGGLPRVPFRARKSAQPWKDPDTGYVRRNISPPNFPSPLQIVDVMLPAGARVAYESGARDASIHQQIWVQEGSIEVTLGKVTHKLDEDDCFAMQLNDQMVFRNRRASRPATSSSSRTSGRAAGESDDERRLASGFGHSRPSASARCAGCATCSSIAVEGGASVSFMHPMTRAKAESFWSAAAAGLARGERLRARCGRLGRHLRNGSGHPESAGEPAAPGRRRRRCSCIGGRAGRGWARPCWRRPKRTR